MKSDHLLDQLSQLESQLNHFSFDELSAEEASELRNSFQSFKTQLEKKIWGEKSTIVHPGVSPSLAKSSKEPRDDAAGLQLVTAISQEIQTPLNGIIGHTEKLQDGELNGDQQAQVQAIQVALNELMNITGELLEFSKLSSGQEVFESVSFNLQSLINEVVYLCKTLIVDKKISLILEMEPDVPEFIKGDPSKLSQVILNLVGNAIKFVKKGEIKLIIGATRSKMSVIELDFKIADNGNGMEEEVLEQMFMPFTPSGISRVPKLNSTGLGLSIIKQIIEQQQGSIAIDSIPGKGSTCHFKIPFKPGKETGRSVTRETSQDPNTVRGSRILVFEDNLLNQKIIEQRLKTWGCIAYITENIRYGLKILEEKEIDLVLMDLCMPVMNGYQVTEIIRNHDQERIARMPVIALTADFTAQDKSDCEQAGMNDFILKPFSAEELLSKLAKFIKGTPGKKVVPEKKETEPEIVTETSQELDLEDMLADCMGQIELLQELFLLFKQNALEFIGKVKMHLENNDYEGIAQSAHKIKCGLKMFQAERLILLTDQMHENSRTDKDPRHLKFLYECFVEEYPLMETRIQKALDALN